MNVQKRIKCEFQSLYHSIAPHEDVFTSFLITDNCHSNHKLSINKDVYFYVIFKFTAQLTLTVFLGTLIDTTQKSFMNGWIQSFSMIYLRLMILSYEIDFIFHFY